MTPVLAVNPKVLIHSADVWDKETEPSVSSDALKSSHCSPTNHHESTGTSHNVHQPLGNDDAKLEPLLRKCHTKSRRGCENCKKRRIKCPENRPICTQCTRRRLECKWPELYINQAEDVKKCQKIPQPVQLLTPVFNAPDFRLFHHFIRDAYPVKPIHNESIWTHEIPSIAHNYDYLLHAMLALSASDIEAASSQHSPELAQSAIFHRVLAIKSLNRALPTGLQTFEEGNALLATSFILLYQSTLMDEGLYEYLTFVRGCVLVPLQMGCRGLKFLFENLLSDDEIEKTRPYMQAMPAIDVRFVDAAYASLENFGPLCEREAEKKMHGYLLEIVRSFYLSSCDAYIAWLKGSVFFSCHISHAEFLGLIEPSNIVGQLLLSHLVAVQTLMGPTNQDKRASRKLSQFVNVMARWLETIHSNVDPTMRSYFEWPRKRAEKVRDWLQHEKALGN
ncbi:hypothetical protein OIDMADRAFT_160662 [Oidiodendron maius Zn]|uniref:Zn(2)-C6 fungal-type domain-containing protein n=1 Tax=Oidiodendron maius (strain Zn) TaxID=913774 RepID=A0A0C3HLB5_OIDMZ|nr:hypothetical protein OIDMADRAFT_160662 [Oidiodendron maius Zn]